MDISFIQNFNELEVQLRGEIDHHCAAAVAKTIDFKIRRHRPVLLIMDFGGVSFMDSSGLAIVMGRKKTMNSIDGSLEIRHLNGSAKKIFEMAHLDRFVTIQKEDIK